MAFTELLARRGRNSKTFADGLLRRFVGTPAALHYESALDSGIFDAEIDTTPARVINAQLDGWRVTQNGFHYALGQPAGKADGWVGFGGRQGQRWLQFRLVRVGYLHGPTRNWHDIGGAPVYSRANLTSSIKSIGFGPLAQSLNLESVAQWDNLWTTPGGGAVSVRWRVNGDQLKEEIVLNAAARNWIAANRPPSFYGIAANEAYFGFVFQVDWSDIPKIMRQGALKTSTDDFADDGSPVELRGALDELLGFMPLDDAIVTELVDTGRLQTNGLPIIEPVYHRQPLRKRFYHDGTESLLAVGLLASDLATFPPGDIVFDPTFNGGGAASTDDALLTDAGYIDNGTTMTWGGSGTTTTNFGMGARIPNVTIPKGATVSSATLDLRSNGQWTTVTWRLTAIDEDNTAAFSSGSPPGARAITGSFISDETLNINHVAGTLYSFPTTGALQSTLGSAIHAVVNRSGWASGNALAIVCNSDQDASAYTGFSRELFRTYDNAPGDAPQITVNYTNPVATYEQEGFRFRNDDGSETTATWRQAQDVDDSIARDTALRMRILLNATNDPPASAMYTLKYRQVGDDTWMDVN